MDRSLIDKSITCAYKIIGEIDDTLKDIPNDSGVANRLSALKQIVNSFMLEEIEHKEEADKAYQKTDTQVDVSFQPGNTDT